MRNRIAVRPLGSCVFADVNECIDSFKGAVDRIVEYRATYLPTLEYAPLFTQVYKSYLGACQFRGEKQRFIDACLKHTKETIQGLGIYKLALLKDVCLYFVRQEPRMQQLFDDAIEAHKCRCRSLLSLSYSALTPEHRSTLSPDMHDAVSVKALSQ